MDKNLAKILRFLVADYLRRGNGEIQFRSRKVQFTRQYIIVGHSFQNYDRVYAGFSAAYTCLHTLRMGFKLINATV